MDFVSLISTTTKRIEGQPVDPNEPIDPEPNVEAVVPPGKKHCQPMRGEERLYRTCYYWRGSPQKRNCSQVLQKYYKTMFGQIVRRRKGEGKEKGGEKGGEEKEKRRREREEERRREKRVDLPPLCPNAGVEGEAPNIFVDEPIGNMSLAKSKCITKTTVA